MAAPLLALLALPAAAQRIELALGTLEHPSFSAQDVKIRFDIFHPGQADIVVAEARVGDNRFRDLKLNCQRFQLDEVTLSCAAGKLQRGKRPPLVFTFDYRFADARLRLGLRDADVAGWSTVVKRLRRWSPVGRFDLDLVADRERMSFDFAVRDLGFHNADYSIAGEAIAVTAAVTARRKGDSWHWRTVTDWSGGEAFRSPWYRRAGVRLAGSGTLTPAQFQVDLARLTFDQLGSLSAGLTWDRQRGEIKRWGFVTDPLDLATAVQDWVRPVLESRALPGISASGATRYAAEWADGSLQSFYAGIEDATFRENSGRLTLTGVNASIPWSRHDTTVAEVTVGGGLLDDFALGGFRLPLHLQGFDVRMPATTIPFLDGHIRIDDFHAARPGATWTGVFSGGIDAVSMPRLSGAMGLPPMAGSLSMRIPSAEYADHVLHLGGDMRIDVFDGQIVVRRLKLVDPLSRTSRFVADVEARRLDLGLLTSTFSFGSIVGRLDADIGDLELQAWRPLAFNARVTSSPGDYRRAISRGALIDISALGGAAGAAAVRAIPAAGFFNTFGYDSIGLGCALKDGVCHLDGLRPEAGGYVLLEGKGIPAIKVMGYNRRIDWKLLVSRLKAVIAGNTKAVIE